LDVTGGRPKITHIPDWIRVIVLKVAKLILNERKFGPVEFFINVMAMDMIAPGYGNHTLKEFIKSLHINTTS
jgi:hypothetical protein